MNVATHKQVEAGHGVTKDYVEAFKWYKKSADQHFPAAQNNLGNIYLYGHGVTEDAFEAVTWYRLAGEQGMSEAQINLGTQYDKGDGVRQDDVMAYMWTNLAAKQGNDEAIKALETLAWRMSFQQKEIARQLTEKCEAKNLKGCE